MIEEESSLCETTPESLPVEGQCVERLAGQVFAKTVLQIAQVSTASLRFMNLGSCVLRVCGSHHWSSSPTFTAVVS